MKAHELSIPTFKDNLDTWRLTADKVIVIKVFIARGNKSRHCRMQLPFTTPRLPRIVHSKQPTTTRATVSLAA